MINKTIFNYLLIGLVLIVVSSCSNNDDTEESIITNVSMELASVDANTTTGESSQVVNINFTLDENQIVNTKVALEIDPANTTATEGVDFVISEKVSSVEAYTRSGSFQVEILADLEAEGDETIAFTVSGLQDPFGATNELTGTLTIQDSIYPSLNLFFDWAPNCGLADLDVYVLDADGVGLGYYDAASANCPETMIIDGWPDGEYFFVTQLYANALFDSIPNPNISYPVTVSAVKGGAFNESFVPTDVWLSDDEPALAAGNYNFRDAFKLTVAGTLYTLEDSDGTILVQGFQAPPGADGKVKRFSEVQ